MQETNLTKMKGFIPQNRFFAKSEKVSAFNSGLDIDRKGEERTVLFN